MNFQRNTLTPQATKTGMNIQPRVKMNGIACKYKNVHKEITHYERQRYLSLFSLDIFRY